MIVFLYVPPMRHEMKLNPEPFEAIKSGLQRFEIRLFDEKRKLVQVGDEIVFSKVPGLKEKLTVKVSKVLKADNFERLFDLFSMKAASYPEHYTPKDFADHMLKFYSKEESAKYGVVAFEVVVDSD